MPGPQRGIAVITAILIAALVASLAFALSGRQRQWLNLVDHRNDLLAAQAMALSAIDLARLTLRDDMRNNQVDHLLESWTIPVPAVNVETGKVGGLLVEQQGKFNLFTLQSSGKVNEAGLLALQRLLSTRNLPTDWAEKLAQALAVQAAQWQRYLLAANKVSLQTVLKPLPVANLSELAELAGIEKGKLAELDDLVTILPESTSVNVNFAPPEVLMAVTPGLSLKEAERLVSRRTTSHFKSGQDFVNNLPENLRTSAKSANYTVESQYFLSEVHSGFGRAYVRLQALIYRQRARMPETVWVKRVSG